MSEDILAHIEKAAVDLDGQKKLPCKKAFQLADELEISLGDIGAMCNSKGIKIIKCQLGCFP